ncbi:MAG: YcaO-like family protein [Candidatus Cloacimonadia bacterium]
MQELKRLKPYKAEDPHRTINKIRNILEECNIFTTEIHSKPYLNLYSCRVEIDGLNNIGTLGVGASGKGMTTKYSLASAYAELIERIQNGIIFPNKPRYATRRYLQKEYINSSYKKMLENENLVLDFEYAPDEKYFKSEEIIENCYNLLKYIFSENNKSILLKYVKKFAYNGEITCLPYYNVKKNSTEYIPQDIIRPIISSNGMCAGNTKEEALIQGICEVFERYAIKKIYKENIIPPTIPLEYFKGTNIHKITKDIEKTKNISVIVKDCSLGLNLPVIGVLLINYVRNEYTFHIGSDPSPISSLERCLSEIFQGNSERFKYLHISQDPFESKNGLSQDKKIKYINFIDTVTSGSGYWPDCIFSDNESYPFEEFEHPTTTSDKEDLKYLVNKIFKLGFDLYVRETSYLGFPAFQVYIPGMSELNNTFGLEGLFQYFEMRKYVPILFNIKSMDVKSIEKIANKIDKVYECDIIYPKLLEISQLFLPNSNNKIKLLTIELLLVMVFYRINNLEKALKYINKYLERFSDEERHKYLYYYCVRDYLKLKIDNPNSMDKVENNLTTFYGKKLAEMVIADFSDPQKIFNNIPLPSCFDCNNCQIKTDCKYFEILHYVKTLQKKQKENPIDQSCLREIFE